MSNSGVLGADPKGQDFKLGYVYHGTKDTTKASANLFEKGSASPHVHSWTWDHEAGEAVQSTETWDASLVYGNFDINLL